MPCRTLVDRVPISTAPAATMRAADTLKVRSMHTADQQLDYCKLSNYVSGCVSNLPVHMLDGASSRPYRQSLFLDARSWRMHLQAPAKVELLNTEYGRSNRLEERIGAVEKFDVRRLQHRGGIKESWLHTFNAWLIPQQPSQKQYQIQIPSFKTSSPKSQAHLVTMKFGTVALMLLASVLPTLTLGATCVGGSRKVNDNCPQQGDLACGDKHVVSYYSINTAGHLLAMVKLYNTLSSQVHKTRRFLTNFRLLSWCAETEIRGRSRKTASPTIVLNANAKRISEFRPTEGWKSRFAKFLARERVLGTRRRQLLD